MKKKLSEAVKNKTIGDIELFEELGVTTDLEIEEHEEFVDWVKDFKVVKKEIKEDFKNIKEDLNMYLTTSEYWKRQAQFYEKQGLPNLGFGVERFNRLPRTVANAFAMLLGGNKKNLQLAMMRFRVNFQNHTANTLVIYNNSVGFAVWGVDTMLNCLARDDFAITVNMVVTLAKLHHRSILKRPLIIQNKLLAVIVC